MKKHFTLGLALFLCSTAPLHADLRSDHNLNQMSTTYDIAARSHYSENDVKGFVYQWFAAFDHQREAGYFLNRLTSPVEMQYPDFPIKSQDDFLRWYRGVTDNIVWNTHHLGEISVSESQTGHWDVRYIVNWKAKSKAGQNYDLFVEQKLHIIRVGDALKIASLHAEVVEPKG